MVSISKLKVFIVTYDGGDSEQVLIVSHELYNTNLAFQKNVTHTKCMDCNVEFNFTEEKDVSR